MTEPTANSYLLPSNAPATPLRPGVAGFLWVHIYLPFAAFYFFLNHAGVDNLGLPLGSSTPRSSHLSSIFGYTLKAAAG